MKIARANKHGRIWFRWLFVDYLESREIHGVFAHSSFVTLLNLAYVLEAGILPGFCDHNALNSRHILPPRLGAANPSYLPQAALHA